jgi:SAM-dependent methyltransferase
MADPVIFDRRLLRERRRRAIALVPADFLLARVADDLAERLSTVLRRFDFAADLGTPGDHVRRALATSGNVGTVVGVDPLASSSSAAIIADEEALPFRDGSLDLVVSALALHFVNDLPGTLIQIRRALKPDGLFLAALLGGETLIELRQAFAQAEAEIEGGISPRVAPFPDLRDLGALLQRAGFALPVADVERLTVRYPTVFSLMHDLRRMGATNALIARSVSPIVMGVCAPPSRLSGCPAGRRTRVSSSRCSPDPRRCGWRTRWERKSFLRERRPAASASSIISAQSRAACTRRWSRCQATSPPPRWRWRCPRQSWRIRSRSRPTHRW